MSAYNSTISDLELRDLFKAALIDGDDTDALTETFIEMERKMVFTAEAAFVLPLLKEQELFSKLHHTATASKVTATAGKLGMKWLLGGLGSACVATGLVVHQLNSGKDPLPAQPSASIMTSLPDSTATEQPEPIDSALVQTPAIFTPETVTKQPDVLESLPPFTYQKEISMQADVPVQEREAAPRGRIDDVTAPTAPPVEPLVASQDDDSLADTLFYGVKRIEVSIYTADIHVTRTSGDVVKMGKGILRSSIEQRGTFLEISDIRSKKKLFRNDENASESESLYLQVPNGTELILRTANGDITVDGVYGGTSEFHCDFGDIRITNSTMKMTVMSSNGDTRIENSYGDLDITSSFGDVTLKHITGNVKTQVASGETAAEVLKGTIDMQSDFGDLQLKNVQGNVMLQSASGNVELDSIYGTTCHVVCDFGNVELTNIHAKTDLTANSGNAEVHHLTGDLVVQSSFGNMTVTDVTGELNLNGNSGNITLKNITGDLHAETQFGDLTVLDTKGNAYLVVNSGSIETKNMELISSLIIAVDFGSGKIGLKNNNKDLTFDVESTFGKVKINRGDMKLEKENGAIVTGTGGISIKGTINSGNLTFN